MQYSSRDPPSKKIFTSTEGTETISEWQLLWNSYLLLQQLEYKEQSLEKEK